MKKLTLFVLGHCPHCRAALGYQNELFAEFPEFKDVPLEIIDEEKRPDVAEQWDYFYVPAYFCGGEKLHEGASTKEKVKAVFEAALR